MLGEGIAFSAMVGVGESYVAVFALGLAFGDVAAGLAATVPMLAGAVLQLVSPSAVGWLGSHKRWVVLCAALQAASFVPLVSGALAGNMSPFSLFATMALYWGLGMATGPAWNTWAGTLVPPQVRATYFARRSRWCNVASLGGLALGAELLRRGAAMSDPLEAYALLFCLALIARAVSAGLLAIQHESKPAEIGDTRILPRAIREHMARGTHGRLLAFLLLFQFSISSAAPFFTPYMLGPLELDPADFAILTGVAFLARIAALPILGRMAHESGTRRLLWLGSSGIVPLPLLWLASDHFVWLLLVQIAAGFAWAAYELAAFLSFFERIPQDARTSILSVYNLAHTVAIVAGSCVGGLVLAYAATNAYAVLFSLSTSARLLSLSLLRGIEDVVPASSRTLPLRTLGLRPSAGAVQRPVLVDPPDNVPVAPTRLGDQEAIH